MRVRWLDKIELDNRKLFHLEILENDELVFDYNGSLEQFLDWLSAPRPPVDVPVAFGMVALGVVVLL